MKPIEGLGISPAPWKLIQWRLTPPDTSAEATHGEIVDAIGQPIFSDYCFPIIEDARLIAAAPKLYEALREAIIEVCGPCYSCSGHPEYACGLKNDSCFVKKWRAVLSEARGEVPNG